MKKQLFTQTVMVEVFILFFTPVFAQGAPPATPIDGGLGILLGAGGLYAYRKLRKGKR